MALDLKNLTLKKEKKDGTPKKAKSDVVLKIMEFFEKNPIMKIVIPVLLFVILAGIFLIIIFSDGVIIKGGDIEDIDVNDTSAMVQVVPDNNIIKDKEIVDLIGEDPLSPDILATAKYTGFVQGSSGLKTALIEIGSENDTLVLSLGETIGDSSWELIEINSKYVTFKAGDITRQIKIS